MTTRPNVPQEALRAIEARWRSRAEEQGYKRLTRKREMPAAYGRAQVEFFVGAMAAFDAQGFAIPPGWAIKLATGRDVLND
jgi:hypothetical protein